MLRLWPSSPYKVFWLDNDCGLAGHVIPGTFFMLWGLHWMQAIFRRHIQSQSTGAQFASRPWFSLAGVCRWFHAAEPLLKMLAGPIGVSVELYFDDKQGLRYSLTAFSVW